MRPTSKLLLIKHKIIINNSASGRRKWHATISRHTLQRRLFMAGWSCWQSTIVNSRQNYHLNYPPNAWREQLPRQPPHIGPSDGVWESAEGRWGSCEMNRTTSLRNSNAMSCKCIFVGVGGACKCMKIAWCIIHMSTAKTTGIDGARARITPDSFCAVFFVADAQDISWDHNRGITRPHHSTYITLKFCAHRQGRCWRW